jgi:hypothetical protein
MGDGTRAIKIAAIAMGVLIILLTTVILVTIVKRTVTGAPHAAGPAYAAVLDEPPGSAILGVAQMQDKMALQLHGGGADRVVLIDPASGAVVGRILLSR